MLNSQNFFPPKEIPPPKDTETPIESPILVSPSSSVRSSSPVRSTTPPPDYPLICYLSGRDMKPLGSEPVLKEPNESDACKGMDWLSKRKFVIVCYKKVVRIPLEGDDILRVHRERTLGAAKALMNTKLQVELCIDLVPRATPVTKSPYRLAPTEMQELSGQLQELKDKVGDALSRKERVKSRRVRGMILAAQSEAFKQENVLAERLHGLDQQMERKGDESLYFMDRIWVLLTLEDIMRSRVIDFGGSYHLSIWCAPFEALYGRKCRSPVLWATIRESSLIRPELVLEMTDKVVLIKEKLKVVRDLHFGKKGKLAPRYVGPIEILERIGLVAYKLRLPEELNSVHDTFHVSNLKKYLADANLHVSLNEIKIDKNLHFVEEPIEIMDCEVKSLKRSRIPLVKVRCNSKRSPEFTWEREVYMKSKYP
ncbi:hypothetical protein Tco_1243511 [Tanacetum coccineum]